MGLFDDRCQSKRGFLSTNGRAVLYLNAASSKAGRPNACDDETLRSTLNVSLQAAVASNREGSAASGELTPQLTPHCRAVSSSAVRDPGN